MPVFVHEPVVEEQAADALPPGAVPMLVPDESMDPPAAGDLPEAERLDVVDDPPAVAEESLVTPAGVSGELPAVPPQLVHLDEIAQAVDEAEPTAVVQRPEKRLGLSGGQLSDFELDLQRLAKQTRFAEEPLAIRDDGGAQATESAIGTPAQAPVETIESPAPTIGHRQIAVPEQSDVTKRLAGKHERS